jgi:hypothetical protein
MMPPAQKNPAAANNHLFSFFNKRSINLVRGSIKAGGNISASENVALLSQGNIRNDGSRATKRQMNWVNILLLMWHRTTCSHWHNTEAGSSSA